MKRVRLVLLIAGILVAGLAFNSVAQSRPGKAKMMSKKEVKAFKHSYKKQKPYKYDKKDHKVKAKHHKNKDRARSNYYFDKKRAKHKGRTWAS